MDTFLERTTAHGLSQLIAESRERRWFWRLICLGAYISMLYSTVVIIQHYMDPNNLKTTITESPLFPKPTKSKQSQREPHQQEYPKLVLCLKDVDLHDINNKEIREKVV